MALMTNNKQQTAVEWLIEQLEEKAFKESVQGANRIHIVIDVNEYLALKQQAKEMEKERIIDAHYEGQCNETEGYPLEISEQYYNETYGGGEQ
jgi:hypothetical protein